MSLSPHAIGVPHDRIYGPVKVTGDAKCAYEHAVQDAA